MIRIPFFTPTSPLEEQHTRNLFELLTQAVLAPLLMVIGAAIMMKSSPTAGFAVVTWTAFGTYIGALASKMMLPRVFRQSVLVTSAGFWASAIGGIVVYFAANLVAQKMGAPHQIENYAEAFAAPVAVVVAMLANVKVARKDFGFSGPINWMTTGFGLLLLGLAVFTTANFEKVDDNHHDCFHHSRPVTTQVTF